MAAAIRRSRDAREARRNRRRRSFAVAAAISIALSGAAIVSLDVLTGADMVHAAVSDARSLAELIGQRSPGQRLEAQLTKTKHARPLERALARTRRQSAPPAPSELANILMGPPAAMSIEPAPPIPLTALSAPSPFVALLPPMPGGGGTSVSPPGGGGSTISPPGGTPQSYPLEPREPVPSAVPEPDTWALMLMGFALIGWRARRTQPGEPALA